MATFLALVVVALIVRLVMKLFGFQRRNPGRDEQGWFRLTKGIAMDTWCVTCLFSMIFSAVAIWANADQLFGFGVMPRESSYDYFEMDSDVRAFLYLAGLTPLFVLGAWCFVSATFTDFRYSPSGIRIRCLWRRTDIAWDQISLISRHFVLGPAIFYGAGKCQPVNQLWLGYADFLAYARSRGIKVDVALKKTAYY